jgi:hypothetical protein
MFLTIPPIESAWSSVLFSCITSLPFLDPRSRMFWTIALIQKWVKFTCRSPRMNPFLFQVNRRQRSAHSRRSKRGWNSLICLLEEITVFSRSVVDNVLYILAHGKDGGFVAAVDKTQFAFSYDGSSIHGECSTVEWYVPNFSVELESSSQQKCSLFAWMVR